MTCQQRIIGLTGGIATGKSTVSQYLAERYHLPVFDADVFARKAVEVGTQVYQAIVQRYGSKVLLSDRTLNRQKLGDLIFRDSTERAWLEQQIHPDVRDRLVAAVANSPQQIIVLVIPLLFEANMTNLVTEIWVVSCSLQQQIARLMQRNHLTQEQAQARIDSQIPLAQKCTQADVILDNSSTPTALLAQVDAALSIDSNCGN